MGEVILERVAQVPLQMGLASFCEVSSTWMRLPSPALPSAAFLSLFLVRPRGLLPRSLLPGLG